METCDTYQESPLERAEGQPPEGTTVSVTLPVAAPDVQAVEAAPELVASAPAQHGAILLSDDEPAIHRALVQLLRRSGHAITTAANGQEGLSALEERSYKVSSCPSFTCHRKAVYTEALIPL